MKMNCKDNYMTFNEIFDELNDKNYIVEFITKNGNVYKIHSHKTKKIIGRKDGYKNKREAVIALLGLKTHGGFYNKTKKEREKMIKNYIIKHKL